MEALLYVVKLKCLYLLIITLTFSACNPSVKETLIPKAQAIPYEIKKGTHWPVPDHWVAVKPGTFQKAKFIMGDQGKQAYFSIVKLEGESGTLLANINRWRKQLFLEAIQENQLNNHVDEIILGKKRYYITKQVNQNAILAATHKASLDVTWFFKLEGDDIIVLNETDNFLTFLKTVSLQE